ncbi:MAG: hypothetical protein KIT14_04515 [bacterium]|nr:hypothetical protein [bacterium]
MALGACAKQAPEPPPPVRFSDEMQEERLPPSTTADFSIGRIRDTRSADGMALFVEGTVRNTGSRPSRDVTVSVAGVGAGGNVIVRVKTQPTPQLIPPGSSASWLVRLPNDPGIRTFHVEAIGR